MPSSLHEALAQVFREVPGLLPELLRRTQLLELPAYDSVSSSSEGLGEAVARELRCDAHLVVVTPNAEVARWANTPVAFGAGAFRPIVLGPREIPAITDEETAMASPDLALLSAIAHGNDPDVPRTLTIARLAYRAALSVEGHRAALYIDLIDASLSVAARKAFDMLPANYELQHPGLRRAWTEGKAEGKAEGVLAVLKARGLSVTAEQRQRILSCADIAQLEAWLQLAVTAPSADALFLH